LSKDLRRRIVAAAEEDTSRRAAAVRFSASESWAIKRMQCWQKTGGGAPARMRAHPKALPSRGANPPLPA
jgi:transposase